MMEQRLIDANALLEKAIEEKRFVLHMEDLIQKDVIIQTAYQDLANFIDSAPTVKAVPVVRCCECVHKRLLNKEEMRFYGSGVLACTRQRTYNDPLVEVNHFCSYGERRDSDG